MYGLLLDTRADFTDAHTDADAGCPQVQHCRRFFANILKVKDRQRVRICATREMFNQRRAVIAHHATSCHSTLPRRAQSCRVPRRTMQRTSSASIAHTCVRAYIRLRPRMYKNPGEEISSSDDGNGTAAAAVADVAIPSASCYFLQRFSVLLFLSRVALSPLQRLIRRNLNAARALLW